MNQHVVIPHIDDVACSAGANRAMLELGASGAVTSGSIMMPVSWAPQFVTATAAADLDTGVHLTLTSESAAFRWRPISTTDPGSGLLDPHGYLWPTVTELRSHADLEAVDRELRAQIDAALDMGIDVTHLDHHMGAAVTQEFVDVTVQIAIDYRLPALFPADIDGYLAVLEHGSVDVAVLSAARTRLSAEGLAVGDTFLMGLTYQEEPDVEATFRRLLSDLPPGTTYLSLHCASPGDIELVHPNDAAWRIGEYQAFSSSRFVEWLHEQPFEIAGMRRYRDEARAV